MSTAVKLPEIVLGCNSEGHPEPIHRIDEHGIWLLPSVRIDEIAREAGCDFSKIAAGDRFPVYFRIRRIVEDTEQAAQICEFLALYGIEVLRPTLRGNTGLQLYCRRENWIRAFRPAFHRSGQRRRNTWLPAIPLKIASWHESRRQFWQFVN